MIVSCPSCGRSNPPWASHCAKCGAQLDAAGHVEARRETGTTEHAGPPAVGQALTDEANDKLAPESTAAAGRGEPADRRADRGPADDDLGVPVAKPAAGSPWPELPPDALAPFLEPETPGSEATVPTGARRTNEPPSARAPVRTEKDPLAGLEPLPAPEPRLGVERLIPTREALAPPPAHPSEPVLPPPSPVEAALGKPAFSDPPLPDPSRLDAPSQPAPPKGPLHAGPPSRAVRSDSPPPAGAPREHSLRQDPLNQEPLPQDPLRQPPLLREPALARSDPDLRTPGDRELPLPSLRADVDVDPATERVPEFGPALEPDTAGHGAIERFGSARELSAARRFADGAAAAAAAAQRVEPTLDPDAVTVTGDPNFPAGDDDPVYGALPPLAGERAGGERTIAPAIQVWSDTRRRRAWRRTGLAIVAIALVLAGGAAAIALIRLTAGDVPASELSVAEVVDRVTARLREFGLLP